MKEEINWECYSKGKGGVKAWCRWISNCPRICKKYLEDGGEAKILTNKEA